MGHRYGSGPLTATARDLERLAVYDWPGNVRELGAVIERAAVLGGGRRLEIERALGAAPATVVVRTDVETRAPPSAVRPLDEVVRGAILDALAAHGGRIDGPRGAARALGVHPNTLRSRMDRLGIVTRRQATLGPTST